MEWFRQFAGDIFSSEAVLTEVLYLFNFSAKAQSTAFDFVLNGAITIVASDLESLRKAKKLMAKYSDVPMDYANATLVCLADDLSIPHVATFDVRGFGIYRLPLKRPFIILP